MRKGTALVTLAGDKLRVLGTFNGLSSPWAQADVYSGDPDDGGESIANLAIRLPDPNALAGGFDVTVTLTNEQVESLQQEMLYVAITTFSSDPENFRVKGKIMSQGSSELTSMETPLSLILDGYPTQRGSVRAIPGDSTLRLVGFFNGLASNWTAIHLTRGAIGDERTPVMSMFSFPDGGLYSGFDYTLILGAGGWKSDFESGLYHLAVEASRPGDGLQGQLLPSGNNPPNAAAVLAPSENETILIGANVGQPPVNPEVLLGTIALEETVDPDDQTVGYWVQFSDRPGFAGPHETLTYNLGVGAPTMPISVSQAAQIYDRFFSDTGISLGTPQTVYVRGVTTDGSLYSVGESIQVTLVRGLVTSAESPTDVPAGFVLHGNYPNPFNPGTKIQFDIATSSDVRVEVYDVSGRLVMVVPAGLLPAGANQTVYVDASSLTSGTYLYRVVAESATGTGVAAGRMTLLK